MRRAAKVDTIHALIRDLFKANGLEWEDTASVGKGFPDALVCYRGRLWLVEVKSGVKADKRKGATATAQFAFALRYPVCRVRSVEDAQDLIRIIKHQEDGRY